MSGRYHCLLVSWRIARVHVAIALLGMLALGAFLAGCSSSSQQTIIGTWRGPCDFPTSSIAFSQVEFLQNDTVLLDSYAGTYSFLDNQRVKLQYGGLGLAFTVATTRNTLTLTDYASSSCTLQRISMG